MYFFFFLFVCHIRLDQTKVKQIKLDQTICLAQTKLNENELAQTIQILKTKLDRFWLIGLDT